MTKLYYWAGICLIAGILYDISGREVIQFFYWGLALLAVVLDSYSTNK